MRCGAALQRCYHVVHVCRARLDNLDHGLGRVLDLDPLLAALHEHELGHVGLSNEHSAVVRLLMTDQHMVVVDELLQVVQIELLLTDTGSHVVIVLGSFLAGAEGLHTSLQMRRQLNRQFPRLPSLL